MPQTKNPRTDTGSEPLRCVVRGSKDVSAEDKTYCIPVGLMGGDLGGLGGRSTQIWGGDGPCIRPPNILRSCVVGCVRKYKLSKKTGVIKEVFL